MTGSFPHFVATLYWSLLALSASLTFGALIRWSWRVALFAAGLSLVCAIAGLASIGVVVLLLTLFQLLLAVKLYRRGA